MKLYLYWQAQVLHDFIEHEFDETYFYQQVRKIKKQSSIIVMFLQMC
jgi:hypothetical protein